MNDLGLKVPARVWTGSSAAIGICGRQRLGKWRHIECHTLWVQQRLRQGDFELRKVRGEVNPADLFTKYLESRTKIDQLLTLFACDLRDGRPAAAPMLRREGLGIQGGSPDEDALRSVEDQDQPMHDPGVLPHHHMGADMEKLFPSIRPAPQCEFGEREIPGADQSLADPINEPYRIRVYRPHKIKVKAVTKNNHKKEKRADDDQPDVRLCLTVRRDDDDNDLRRDDGMRRGDDDRRVDDDERMVAGDSYEEERTEGPLVAQCVLQRYATPQRLEQFWGGCNHPCTVRRETGSPAEGVCLHESVIHPLLK